MHLADITGIGRTRAAEHWTLSLVDLAVEAAGYALRDGSGSPTAIVVGNALGSALGDQRNLAAYVTARLGLVNVETLNVEMDEASGGAAIRAAIAYLQAGFHEEVLVIGAEKTTDVLPDGLEAARANGLDVLRESGFGFSGPVAAALAMQRYIAKYEVRRAEFYHLSAVAHAHAARNKDAFFSWPLAVEQYQSSQVVADPVTVCDTAPPCDGAAAVVLRKPKSGSTAVRIKGSSSISCRPGIAGPAMDLTLPAARLSATGALSEAGLSNDDISLFELHDSSTIMAALSLEAVGIAEPGRALEAAANGLLSIEGKRPTFTFGGHKARGHAIGASGVYQVVEATAQIRGEAGENQVSGATSALVQCLGSFGSTAVTHVLGRE